MKFNAYIDGFNLYKGALQRRPDLKWLDLKRYCSDRLINHKLEKVYFFTSRIKEKYSGDAAPRRQHAYLRALEESGVEVVLGKFRRDVAWQRLVSPIHLESISPHLEDPLSRVQKSFDTSAASAHPDSIQANVWKYGEKGTDVNFASYLLRDIFKFQFADRLKLKSGKIIRRPQEWRKKEDPDESGSSA